MGTVMMNIMQKGMMNMTNGGRTVDGFFSDGGLNVEVTIFEKGVPPQFRVYVTGDNGKLLPLEDVTITI